MSLLVTGEHSFYKFMVLTNKNRVLVNILPGEYRARAGKLFIGVHFLWLIKRAEPTLRNYKNNSTSTTIWHPEWLHFLNTFKPTINANVEIDDLVILVFTLYFFRVNGGLSETVRRQSEHSTSATELTLTTRRMERR